MQGVSPDVVVGEEPAAESNGATVQVARPNFDATGEAGSKFAMKPKTRTPIIDFRNKESDIGLRRAIDVARESTKLALRSK